MSELPVTAPRGSVPLGIFVFALAAMVCLGGRLLGEPQSLEVLREEYAISYFEPVAHLQLARGLRENDRALTAFFVSETARRTLVEQGEFDEAFAEVFLPPDPFDNTKLPWAVTRGAIDYYLDRVAQIVRGRSTQYDFNEVGLSYTAALEESEEGPRVRVQLEWSQSCGPDCGLFIEHTREVLFDESGEVIDVTGDGCPHVVVN